MNKKIRDSILGGLALLCYSGFLIIVLGVGFGSSYESILIRFVTAFCFVAAYVVIFNLFSISLQDEKYKHITVVVSWLLLLFVGLYAWFAQVQHGLLIFAALTIFQLGVIRFVYAKMFFLDHQRIISKGMFVRAGVVNFAAIAALSFALLGAGMWKDMLFNCQDLYDTLRIPIQQQSMTVGDVLDIKQSDVDMLEKMADLPLENNPVAIIGRAQDIQEALFKQVIQDREMLNQGICETVVQLINQRANKGTLTISVILLLFFIAYPLTRMVFILVSLLSYVVLWGGSLMGIWKKETIMREVETIS